MPYFKEQEKWLEIAEASKPTLYRRDVKPNGLVKAKRNSHDFQGWRMHREAPISKLYKMVLGEGDKFILDFGEHIVGYLHFSLNFVGKAMGGPLRLKFIFGEVPAEVCEQFDPFKGTLSRAWLQDEVITLDTLPQTIHLPRRFAFRYLKIEIIAASFDCQIQFSSIHCETVTSATMPIENLENP